MRDATRPARRDRDGADRLLRLRRPGAVLRRARAGDPRERRRTRRSPGLRTLFALIPPGPDRRSLGRHRASRTSSPTSSSRRPPTTRITSRRAGSTRASPSTRARATARDDRAQVEDAPRGRTAHPARRADRPVPDQRRRLLSWPMPRACPRSTTWSGPTAATPLVSLIRSYADGRTDDEAFSAALGHRHDRRSARPGWPISARRRRPGTDRSRRRPARSRRPGAGGRRERRPRRQRSNPAACRQPVGRPIAGGCRRRRAGGRAMGSVLVGRHRRDLARSSARCLVVRRHALERTPAPGDGHRPASRASRAGRSRSAWPCSSSAS